VGCATKRPIANNEYILAARPIAKPNLPDKSPMSCPECLSKASQKMLKFTERDFIKLKEKLIELDDYIEYLIELVEN